MNDGLNNYLEEKGLSSVEELVGQSVSKYSEWGNLDLNYKVVARIDTETCINCNKCHIACEDTSHQCIDMLTAADGSKYLEVREEDCVGCNLCQIVCPVDGVIDMIEIPSEKSMTWNERQAAIKAPVCSVTK